MKRLLQIFLLFILVSAFFTTAFSSQALATGMNGNHSLTLGLGLSTATQSDLNSWSSAQGSGGGQLSSAYEYSLTYEYRFSSTMFAFEVRPSYFTESASGGGTNTSLTGTLVYPMLRLYPLENSFIHFFLQAGVGWGQLSGTTTFGGNSVSYSGSAFGAIMGLGARFCFTDHQCMTIEGDARYNLIDRSIVSSASSTSMGGLQTPVGHELEYNSNDVGNTLSGIQGILQYNLMF